MAIILGKTFEQKLRQNEKIKAVIPPENYLYFHHLGKGITIPIDPDNISDSMSASWSPSTPLSRSAPIQSYSSSGPRSVSVQFLLHRDLVKQYNPDWIGKKDLGWQEGYDVVDLLINNLEACVLPTYQETGKIVNPPVISLKIRDEIYIKGIVSNVSKGFQLPIINYGTDKSPSFKYAQVNLGFGVTEITPYDASIIRTFGGFRKHQELM